MPADKYTWRTSAGMRTMAKIFPRSSAANHNLYGLAGTPVQGEGFKPNLQNIHYVYCMKE